ncbi:MAG: glycoside hydrolase family 18 [Bacteroidales bacterium]|nr:glycoside hydrolase family 18 [Candidatus Cacconaster merdequi]
MKSRTILLHLLLLPVVVIVIGCNPLTPAVQDPSRKEPAVGTPGNQRPPHQDIALNDLVEGHKAIGYVPYYRSSIPDGSTVTHINYAFAELYVRDGKYQGFKVQGKESRFVSIAGLKTVHPDLKILLSFTHGVSNSDNVQGGGFSAMASSEEDRKLFAEDCLAFLQKWGIDGIDIDWEFPGLSWSGAACDPKVDTDNYVLMMKQLRETLGEDYLLTYAGYCKDKQTVSGGYKYIDIEAVDPYVDWVNIMTYDMDAAPHPQSAINSPSAYVDCSRAVDAYLKAGVSPEKIVLGVPFYGRHAWSGDGAAISYRSIIELPYPPYKIDNWDSQGSVPYVTYNGTYYCSYENPKSIAAKGEWIKTKGIKGMMFWEYDEDDAYGTLRRSLWNAVMQ